MDRGVRVFPMSDLYERSVEEPRTERARRAAATRWCVLAALEGPLGRRFVVAGNHDVDRKAQAAVCKWVRREIPKDLRTCSEWMAGGDRGVLRVGARRDEGLERQEVHPRCGQG